jgi:superfamily II DNA or RNA helicase
MLTQTLKHQVYDPKYGFLKYHQNLVREFLKTTQMDSRGLLIKHEMGMGKSILAIAIAMDSINDRQPIMLLTKSLQDNMKESIRKYVALRGEYEPEYLLSKLSAADLTMWINKHFDFVSLNAGNMLAQMARLSAAEELETKIGNVLGHGSLEGKLLIVDEAHNLFRAITNGSKNGMGLYDVVVKSRNLKVIFLTGTPIANDPFEMVPCFNMLGSRKFRNLPEDYTEFTKLYVDGEGCIKNAAKFQNRIMGLVSSVDHLSTPGAGIGVTEEIKIEFPEELPLIEVRCPMDPDQFTSYQMAKDKEADESTGKAGMKPPASMTKPAGMSSSSYKVKSRQLSNYHSGVGSPKYKKILENVMTHGNLGVVYSQFTKSGGLGSLGAYLQENDWEDITVHRSTAPGPGGPLSDALDAGPEEDREITGGQETPVYDDHRHLESILQNMERFTWWKTGGVDPDDESSNEGIEAFLGAGDHKKFAIYTGELEMSERSRLVELFNSPENAHGGMLDLLLISSVGAEGLDLHGVRHVHVMEPYWNWGRVAQVISRGVRNGSHKDYPADEKNVQPYIYLAVSPEDPTTITTDIELYQEALKNKRAIATYIQVLNEVAIECVVNGAENCRQCAPTGRRLITPDASVDARSSDPCEPGVEQTVEAKAITHEGKEYFYTPSDGPFGYTIYVTSPELNIQLPLKETDPVFMELIKKINPQALVATGQFW